MKHRIWKRLWIFLALILCMALPAGCTQTAMPQDQNARAVSAGQNDTEQTADLREDGTYTSKDEVALYIHIYQKLPGNYITKKEARSLGWEGGSLEPYAPGKSIGGDIFGNYEEQLPRKKGRSYRECDIDAQGKKRGAKRIVYSDDGLIYYTDDHYETFTLLYGDAEE